MSDVRRNVSQYETEIREQPEALRRLLSRSKAVAEDLGRRIEKFKPKFVVIAPLRAQGPALRRPPVRLLNVSASGLRSRADHR